MHRLARSIVCAALLVVGCNKEDAKPQADGSPPAAPSAKPTDVLPDTPKMSLGPTTHMKDIQGVWQTEDGATQFEFTGSTLAIRNGPGPNWTEKGRYPFVLRDQIMPRQIDWGAGPDAGYGLYTLDGKDLILDYNLADPAARPKRPGKQANAKQIWLKRPK